MTYLVSLLSPPFDLKKHYLFTVTKFPILGWCHYFSVSFHVFVGICHWGFRYLVLILSCMGSLENSYILKDTE